jgi:hypothetical protein
MQAERRESERSRLQTEPPPFFRGLLLRPNLTRWTQVTALLTFLVIVCGCAQPQQQREGEVPGTRSGTTQFRDLARDEQRGGHTLKRHVGKSDTELRTRLTAEPNISAASTYTDRETAESTVGEALGDNQPRVEQWLHRRGGHPNLVLDIDGRQPLGRSLRRNASTSEPCSHALVVLKWMADDDFIVLTSYPECR